jgi:uncharacterized protein (TIGR02145 family)
MKKILLGFIGIGLLTFVGCDKDDDTDIEMTDNQTVNNTQTNSNTLSDDESSETDTNFDDENSETEANSDGDITDTNSDDNTTDTNSNDDTADTINITSSIQYGNGVTDVDGSTYQSVIIGEQEWMAENLRTSKYSDGTDITNVIEGYEWEDLNTGAWCHYDNNSDNDTTYGKLYNWYSVETSKLCPTDWHVPTDADWTVLIDYLGANGHNGTQVTALKAISGWSGSENGTDDYGWNGLPGGVRFDYGGFHLVRSSGYWWSSSLHSGSNAWFRGLYLQSEEVDRDFSHKKDGFSVRCLRD